MLDCQYAPSLAPITMLVRNEGVRWHWHRARDNITSYAEHFVLLSVLARQQRLRSPRRKDVIKCERGGGGDKILELLSYDFILHLLLKSIASASPSARCATSRPPSSSSPPASSPPPFQPQLLLTRQTHLLHTLCPSSSGTVSATATTAMA